MPNVSEHHRGSGYISIRFFVNAGEHDKQISIIPVKAGMEKQVSVYANDKFTIDKCEVIIFLLDEKEQIERITADCNCKFAVITKKGVELFKK